MYTVTPILALWGALDAAVASAARGLSEKDRKAISLVILDITVRLRQVADDIIALMTYLKAGDLTKFDWNAISTDTEFTALTKV